MRPSSSVADVGFNLLRLPATRFGRVASAPKQSGLGARELVSSATPSQVQRESCIPPFLLPAPTRLPPSSGLAGIVSPPVPPRSHATMYNHQQRYMGSGSSSSRRPRGALSTPSSSNALSSWADWAAKSLDPDAITTPLQMQVGE